MDKQHEPGQQQQPDPGAGPEEAIRGGWRGAVPDERDTEGHAVRFRPAIPEGDAPGPDEAVKFGRAVPDEQDTEGHALRWRPAVPEGDESGT